MEIKSIEEKKRMELEIAEKIKEAGKENHVDRTAREEVVKLKRVIAGQEKKDKEKQYSN